MPYRPHRDPFFGIPGWLIGAVVVAAILAAALKTLIENLAQ